MSKFEERKSSSESLDKVELPSILPSKVLVDVAREVADILLYSSEDPSKHTTGQIQRLFKGWERAERTHCERRIEEILFADKNIYTCLIQCVGEHDAEGFAQIIGDAMFEVSNFELGKKLANETVKRLIRPIKARYFENAEVFSKYILEKYSKLRPYPNEHWQAISRQLKDFWMNLESPQKQTRVMESSQKQRQRTNQGGYYPLWLHDHIFAGTVSRSLHWESLRYDECGNFYKKNPRGQPIWEPYYPYNLPRNDWDEAKHDIRGIVTVFRLEVISVNFPKDLEDSRGFILFKELKKRPTLEEILDLNSQRFYRHAGCVKCSENLFQ